MEKDNLFFSHSSRDAKPMGYLTDRFKAKTSGFFDVFMSSDGQSIPFGSNWVHSLEDALKRTKLMFVFVSPASINSNWIYFESGHAYGRGIHVVPVGILGLDLSTVRPPLGHLQGFNLNSNAAADNLIAVVNERFNLEIESRFSCEEYSTFESLSPNAFGPQTSFLSRAIESVQISALDCEDNVRFFETMKITFSSPLAIVDAKNSLLNYPGMECFIENDRPTFQVDIEALQIVLPKIVEVLIKNSIHCVNGYVNLGTGSVEVIANFAKISARLARLARLDVTFPNSRQFKINGITALIAGGHPRAQSGIVFNTEVEHLTIENINRLFSILIETELIKAI